MQYLFEHKKILIIAVLILLAAIIFAYEFIGQKAKVDFDNHYAVDSSAQ